MEESLKNQSKLFCKYIIGQEPSVEDTEKYVRISKKQYVKNMSKKDEQLFELVERHPECIKYIDSYLAIFKPDSEVRHRIYIMFCILESNPNYWNSFISEEKSYGYLLILAWYMIRSFFDIIIGIMLVTFL